MDIKTLKARHNEYDALILSMRFGSCIKLIKIGQIKQVV